MDASWIGPIRVLCDILLRHEQSVKLLRRIDAGMRDVVTKPDEATIDALLADALERTRFLTDASAISLFFFYQKYTDKPLLIYSSAPESNHAAELVRLLSSDGSWNGISLARFEYRDLEHLQPRGTNQAFLRSLIPLPDATVVGALVLESPNPAAFQEDSATIGLVTAVSEQLSNLFHLYESWSRRSITSRLLDTFLDRELRPNQCLQALAQSIPDYLPDLGPLRLHPRPQVQILFFKPGDNHLTIRATTGQEPPITRVNVQDSVCGYLVEDENLDHYLCDPTTERRYKRYLGREDDAPMRAELAVPVRDEGRLIAVLNLESPTENAFYPQHVDAAQRAAADVASWISAIRNRIDIGFAKEQALTEVMENYVVDHGRMLSHNAGNKLASLVTTLENLARETVAIESDLSGRLKMAHETARSFMTFLEDFVSHSKDAGKIGPYPIAKLITDAIELVKDLQRSVIDLREVSINFNNDVDYVVYCSKIFRQHLYNIIDNAIIWIAKNKERNPDAPGIIEITVDRVEEGGVDQERGLNARCRIIVRDSGPGVPIETLEKLREFPLSFTLRASEGGTGYGLWALRQYLESVGGWLTYNSLEGEFFEVVVVLDIYDELIHSRARNGSGW
jgi:signal transduction histidine kinase